MPTEPFLGIADPISAVTHLAGAALAARALPGLLRRAPAAKHARLAFGVFGATCILLLATSGVYHILAHGSATRELFQRLDHAAIFLLIAGCYTPVHAWLFRGPLRWGVLSGIWGLAFAGLAFKTIFFAQVPEAAGIGAYLLLGWLGLGTAWFLWRHLGPRFIAMPLLGGLAFSVGGIVGAVGAPNPLPGIVGPHELFHIASLAGVYAFWRFMAEWIARVEPVGDPFARAPGEPASLLSPSSSASKRAT